jgi:hypothetical protein
LRKEERKPRSSCLTMTQNQPSPTTRSATKKQVFDRIFKEVFELEDDDPLILAIAEKGTPSISYVIEFSEQEINALAVTEADGTVKSIPSHCKSLIRILQSWNMYLIDQLGVRRIDWLDNANINVDEFGDFRSAIYDPNAPLRKSMHSHLAPASNPGTFGGSGYSSSKNSPAADFRRGVKRDKGHYSTMKDEKQWDEWKRSTISTIYAHGCENIISSAYIPLSPDDINLFQEQNKFMYDVFLTILRTSMGKHFVRTYDLTRDAQSVWKDYTTYMRTSTKADMEIEDLMTVITSFRLTSTYRGTSQRFIVDWLDKIRRYEDLTPKSAHFPDVMKKSMLQNALNDISAFSDVRTSEQMDIAKGNGPIVYKNYVTLIQNVAGTYDKVNATVINRRRTVNSHHFYDNDTDIVPYDVDDLDFGSMSVYDINQHHRAGNNNNAGRPKLKYNTWKALSQDDQSLWDQLTDEAKSVIIRNHNADARQPSNTAANPTFQPHRRPIKANVHEVDTSSDDSDFVDALQDANDDVPESSLLVNAATQGTRLCPGDIRNVLSSSAAKKRNPNNVRVRTQEASVHELVTYRVSNHHASSVGRRGALVDRGANGGLVGNDV